MFLNTGNITTFSIFFFIAIESSLYSVLTTVDNGNLR
jgi:hypothetical protein